VQWACLVVLKYALFNGPNTDTSQTERIQNQFNWKTFSPPVFFFCFPSLPFFGGLTFHSVFFFFFSFFWIVCDVIAAFLLAEKSLWELTKFNQNCVQFRFRVEMNDFRDAFKTLMRRNVMAVTRMNTISQWATHGSSSLFYAVSSSWTINCQRRPRRQSSSFVKNFVAYLVAARYCI